MFDNDFLAAKNRAHENTSRTGMEGLGEKLAKRLKEGNAEAILEKCCRVLKAWNRLPSEAVEPPSSGPARRHGPEQHPPTPTPAKSGERRCREQRGRRSEPGHRACAQPTAAGSCASHRGASRGVKKAALQGHDAAPPASRLRAARHQQQLLLERSKGNIPELILSSCLIRG